MDEIWERAVETALDGQKDHAAARSLTLDGAVKCVHGRLPHPSVFERFANLQHLSLANIGLSSLEQFPQLVNLQKLVLSDNRIAGGLECLVEAGLRSLVDLDLSNNRLQFIEDLVPLAELRLVSLDLYECPVTRVKDYRARVFGLIKSLKYLDKMDAEENETPESDEEEEDEEGEEDEEEDDQGNGEVDGGDRFLRTENGHGSVAADVILEGDDDEESDAAEEENEIVTNGQYAPHEANGFRMVRAEEVGDDGHAVEIEEDNSSGEDIDEEDAEEDEVVEVHEVPDSDEEDDDVEYEEGEDDDGDENDDDEEVDNEEQGVSLASSTGRIATTEGEIDGHEQGEDDADEDDNGETGEENEQGMEEGGYNEEVDEEDEDDDEESGLGYLVQPVSQQAIANEEDDELSEIEPVNDDEDEEVDDDIYDGEGEDVEDDIDNNHQVPQVEMPPSSSLHSKRKRTDEDEEEDDDDSGEEDDMGHPVKLPKKDP